MTPKIVHDVDNVDIESRSTVAGKGTQVLVRSVALLREIASCNRSGSRLADLAARSGLQRPTVHRILRGLVAEGLVTQDPRDRVYRLGPLAYELGLAAAPPTRLQELCGERLDALAEGSGDVVFLIAPSGHDSVCLDRREGGYPVKALMLDIGRRRPLGVGAGSLAILSRRTAEETRQVLQLNARRLMAAGEPDINSLLERIDEGRRKGYVLRETTEVPGISSIAVPVTDGYGVPLCALSITSLRYRIESREVQLVSALRRESKLLAAQWSRSSGISLQGRVVSQRAQSSDSPASRRSR